MLAYLKGIFIILLPIANESMSIHLLTIKSVMPMKKILFLLVVMLVNTVSLFAEEKVVTITGKDSL